MKPDLSKLQAAIGYEFHHLDVLKLALTHRSAHRRANNERLEFLGDAQLGEIIARDLYDRFPAATEGQLTRMRSVLVRGKTLAEVAMAFSLGDYLTLGSGELKSGGFRRESILADALEALIGAILLDGGDQVCREKVLSWFADRLQQVTPDSADKDPKTRLQEWLQARQQPVPEYHVAEVTGQAPKQQFTVSCQMVITETPFVAVGTSRRKAEQRAAQQALDWLETHHV